MAFLTSRSGARERIKMSLSNDGFALKDQNSAGKWQRAVCSAGWSRHGGDSVTHRSRRLDLDVNPLLVCKDRAIAADALIRMAGNPHQT
jgi:hypothetical protein